MAEALVNHQLGESWEAVSAGTHPTGYVHPLAVAALQELGIDASHARSKSTDEFRNADLDLVVTVCDDAAEECPIWLGQGQRVHIGFPDPAEGSLDAFRDVCEGIQERVIPYLEAMNDYLDK